MMHAGEAGLRHSLYYYYLTFSVSITVDTLQVGTTLPYVFFFSQNSCLIFLLLATSNITFIYSCVAYKEIRMARNEETSQVNLGQHYYSGIS
jgi:hypothetical protein